MEKKSKSPIYFDSYKPVGWSWPGTLLMYTATGGFGFSALLGNKLATKFSVENNISDFSKLRELNP